MTRNVVLVDIDHVLSDAFWRDPMIGAVTWDEYHAAAKDDAPLHHMAFIINMLWSSGQYEIIAITARPEKWRKMTMEWMLKYNIKIDELLMRPDDTFRPSTEIKLELARERFPDLHVIALVLEDRDDVVAAFKAEGITVLQVHAAPNRREPNEQKSSI